MQRNTESGHQDPHRMGVMEGLLEEVGLEAGLERPSGVNRVMDRKGVIHQINEPGRGKLPGTRVASLFKEQQKVL